MASGCIIVTASELLPSNVVGLLSRHLGVNVILLKKKKDNKSITPSGVLKKRRVWQWRRRAAGRGQAAGVTATASPKHLSGSFPPLPVSQAGKPQLWRAWLKRDRQTCPGGRRGEKWLLWQAGVSVAYPTLASEQAWWWQASGGRLWHPGQAAAAAS